MVEIFSSIIGFSRSILDYEKNVSRTLNSRDDASLKDRAFFITGGVTITLGNFWTEWCYNGHLVIFPDFSCLWCYSGHFVNRFSKCLVL